MEQSVRLKLEEMNRMAKENGKPGKITLRGRSSLHSNIRTKEQADFFMKMLREASESKPPASTSA